MKIRSSILGAVGVFEAGVMSFSDLIFPPDVPVVDETSQTEGIVKYAKNTVKILQPSKPNIICGLIFRENEFAAPL